jgi:RNA polymerase I-specific transcription initiation factor RRN6
MQNAHSKKLLNYGHLGTISYHEKDKTWETLRIAEPATTSDYLTNIDNDGHTAFPLRHLAGEVVYEGLAGLQYQTESGTNKISLHHGDGLSPNIADAKAEGTTKTHADYCQKGSSLFPVEQSPNHSALLAFGSAVSAGTERGRSDAVNIPIAASVSSSDSQTIRLVKIGRGIVKNHWTDGEDVPLHVPYISNEDEAYWKGGTGAVQQICFAAATGYSSTWMAARLLSCTTIFHPLLHQGPVPPRYETSQVPLHPLPASVLDANPILTIPISRTGGHHHADVSFHPKDHLKIALIDDHGNWNVWHVDEERHESLRCRYRVNLIHFGKLWTWDFEKRLKASLPYHDGWHRISWCIGSGSPSDKLFICNRRTAAVYKISGELVGLPDFQLGHSREKQMILDIHSSKRAPCHYFVLTSTRLYWIRLEDIKCDNSSRDQSEPDVLLAWRHFRDHGDTTLHLVLLESELCRYNTPSLAIELLIFLSHRCAYDIAARQPGFSLSSRFSQ